MVLYVVFKLGSLKIVGNFVKVQEFATVMIIQIRGMFMTNERVILLRFSKVHFFHHDEHEQVLSYWLNDYIAQRLHDFEEATKLT